MTNVQEKSRWTFIRQTVFGRQSKAIYRCKCGTEKELYINSVRLNRSRSCGCLQKELFSKAKTHGLYYHPLHSVWSGIKQRCYKPTNAGDFKQYKERGVIMCKEWRDDFKTFYDWAINNGWEAGLQIDKDIKGNGLVYSPQTCCFVMPKVNSNNRRNNRFIMYDGRSQTISMWCDELKLNKDVIYSRIERGWSIKDAFTRPIRIRTR